VAGVLAELEPLLRRQGDLFLLPWAVFERGFLAIAAADWEQATAATEAAIELNQQAGYPHWKAWYLAHLGWFARLRGRQDEALGLGRQALDLSERHEHSWWKASACAMLGGTLLLGGDREGAIGLFERGLAAAQHAGLEAYLLRTAAPLAAATGSPAVLEEAAGLLERASIPADGAWMLGYEAYLSLAEAWLAQGKPDRARAVLAPLLAVADREPWLTALAAALAADGRALVRLGDVNQARTEFGRAERLAAEHGLPHVRREAREALLQLG
jgi:tetratricopeptide (TPR) repeat protein